MIRADSSCVNADRADVPLTHVIRAHVTTPGLARKDFRRADAPCARIDRADAAHEIETLSRGGVMLRLRRAADSSHVGVLAITGERQPG
jgi:hypothetical protein